MKTSPSLSFHLLKFAHVFSLQLANTAVANARGTVEERLARFLLMVHDRTEGDDIQLTHEILAGMLGTRRAGVTVALNRFEAKALIGSVRGRISVLDRPGLEAIANGFYGSAEAEYDHHFFCSGVARSHVFKF
jgi:CRP-like cAMP-binding protein